MSKYTVNDLKVLEQMESIRMRPGMFVGELSDATQLLEEALDNALDELVHGADRVRVDIDTKKHEYIVYDSGRGMPLENVDGHNVPAPVVLSTNLFSGGKFDGSKAYDKSKIGLNGVGLVVVNALSDEFSIETGRDKKRMLFSFEDSVLKETKKIRVNKEWATIIRFVPGNKFDSRGVDINFFRRRLRIASSFFPTKTILLYVDGKEEMYCGCRLRDIFVEEFGETQEIHEISGGDTTILFGWDTKSFKGKKGIGFVNLLPVDSGPHMTIFEKKIKEEFCKHIGRSEATYDQSSVFSSFRYIVNTFVLNPEFSQIKDKLLNKPKDVEESVFSAVDFRGIFDNIGYMEGFFNAYTHKYFVVNNVSSSIARTNSRGIVSTDSNLRDCTSTDTEKTELFIVEGKSASGCLVQCRDKKKHAILPLRGKILNVGKKSGDAEAFESSTIKDILFSIGYDIKTKKVERIRYGKIIILADADDDGKHIAVLVAMAICKMCPDIIRDGRVYICEPPIYGMRKKRVFVPIYNDRDLEREKKKNPKADFFRFKGLGEMSPEDLGVAAISDRRVLHKICMDEGLLSTFSSLMKSPAVRKEFLKQRGLFMEDKG